MKVRLVTAIAPLSLVLCACDKSSRPYQAATPQPTSSPNAIAETPKIAPTAPAINQTEQAKPDEFPVALKNDSYRYYGLGNAKERFYQLKSSGSPISNGIQTISLDVTKIDPAKVEFEEKDAGAPSVTTTQDMSLDDSGIYVDSISPQKLNTPHFLELPSKLKVGTEWSSSQSVNSGSQSLSVNLQYKAVKQERLKTPAGTFDALHVVGTGAGSLGASPAQMKVESWFVKDVGLVKQIATIKSKGISSTVETTLQK